MNTNMCILSPYKVLWHGLTVLLPALILVTGLTITERVNANNLNVHPASCFTPFLDQAFPMRWHENYLMNPTSGVETWIICPLNFDPDVHTFTFPFIEVEGAVMSGASSDSPLCFFRAYDKDNLAQPPYIGLPGGAELYTKIMNTFKTSPRWVASVSTNFGEIASGIGSAGTSQYQWGVAVFCKLPIGHGISLIRFID